MSAYSGESPTTERRWIVAAYILHLVGAVLALPSLIAVVINYLKVGTGSTFADSHHRWMIRTFWWAVVWTIVIVALYIMLIGFLIGGILSALLWLWWIYRHVRGLLRMADGQSMP